MTKRVLNTLDEVGKLEDKLRKYKVVNQFNKKGYLEASTIAHSMQDLEESFNKFLSELLPRLVNEELNEVDMSDLLLDISMEFKHIYYHLRDAETFKPYVSEENIPKDN